MKHRDPALAVLALFVAVALGTAACSSTDSDTSTAGGGSTQTQTQTSKATNSTAVQHLDPAAFATLISQPSTVVVDVRTASEFAEGHIAQATNIDVQATDFAEKIAVLDKTASYAIYCRSGSRSATAAGQMMAAGFTTVVDLAGGVTAWSTAGNKLITS